MSKLFFLFVLFTFVFIHCCVCNPEKEKNYSYLGIQRKNGDGGDQELNKAKDWGKTVGTEEKKKRQSKPYAVNL
ncbi:hypothetical protein ACQ4LE_009291 [Meloidogyne hapla]